MNPANLSFGNRDIVERINMRIKGLEHAAQTATRAHREAAGAMWDFVDAAASITSRRFEVERALAELEDESNDADARARHAEQKLAWEERNLSAP